MELRRYESLSACMPLMLGWFTSPCTTSPTHATEQVNGAAEGWFMGRREVACSAVSGKPLARTHAWSSMARTPAPASRRPSTSGHSQVVADYTRPSAVQAAACAGHRQASGLQYPGLAAARSRSATSPAGASAADRTQQQPLRAAALRGQHLPSRIRLSRAGLGLPLERLVGRFRALRHSTTRTSTAAGRWALSVGCAPEADQDDCASGRHPRDAR